MGHTSESTFYDIGHKKVEGSKDIVKNTASVSLETDDKNKISIRVAGSKEKINNLLAGGDNFACPAAGLLGKYILRKVGNSVTLNTIVATVHEAGAQGVTTITVNGKEYTGTNDIEHWLPPAT